MKKITSHDSLTRINPDPGLTVIEVIGRTAAIPFAKCSLAECSVAPGCTIPAHLHTYSDEIYLFTSGRGEMEVNREKVPVAAGTVVLLEPGDEHSTRAIGPEALRCWAITLPAYSIDDHVLTRNHVRAT